MSLSSYKVSTDITVNAYETTKKEPKSQRRERSDEFAAETCHLLKIHVRLRHTMNVESSRRPPLPTPGSTPSPALDGGDKLTSLSAKNPNTHQSDTRTHVAVVSCHAAPKYGVARGFIHSGP
jgi:hypothetical protein